MRWMALLLLFWPLAAAGQSSTVLPQELQLEVRIEDTGVTPLAKEMLLLTIRGTYRRHITRETLVQPDFDGFNWSQLGPDTWKEERLDGKKVKVFERRMAIYPGHAGELTIGAFTHRLTLTDEGDDWFEHEIRSEPVKITVDPAPPTTGWWFPVRDLKIFDEWSNAPEQLRPGEGVLRVIRIEALGATPEMIPPMPELTSPSGMVFAHPEKRLVELTPHGPLTYAFWRWTIRPGNDVSTIVEPLDIEFFNTTTRLAQTVTISPQRVAYGERTPSAGLPRKDVEIALPTGELPGLPALLAAGAIFASAVMVGLRNRAWSGMPGWSENWKQRRALRRAARRGDIVALRRALSALALSGPQADMYRARLRALDQEVFSESGRSTDLGRFS